MEMVERKEEWCEEEEEFEEKREGKRAFNALSA